MFIGLMGVESDGMLVTPSGRRLFRVTIRLASLIQRIQHWIAQLSWKRSQNINAKAQIKCLSCAHTEDSCPNRGLLKTFVDCDWYEPNI